MFSLIHHQTLFVLQRITFSDQVKVAFAYLEKYLYIPAFSINPDDFRTVTFKHGIDYNKNIGTVFRIQWKNTDNVSSVRPLLCNPLPSIGIARFLQYYGIVRPPTIHLKYSVFSCNFILFFEKWQVLPS